MLQHIQSSIVNGCSTHHLRHVVVDLLEIELWRQLSLMAIMTFNSVTWYHAQTSNFNSISNTMTTRCSDPTLPFIDSMIVLFVSLYKFKISYLFSDGMIYRKCGTKYNSSENKILFRILSMVFVFRNTNYNITQSEQMIQCNYINVGTQHSINNHKICTIRFRKMNYNNGITLHTFEMVNNIGNNKLYNLKLLSLQFTKLLREKDTYSRFIIKFDKVLTESKLRLPKVSNEIKLVSKVVEEAALHLDAQEAVKST